MWMRREGGVERGIGEERDGERGREIYRRRGREVGRRGDGEIRRRKSVRTAE